jgi:hypothetical protein
LFEKMIAAGVKRDALITRAILKAKSPDWREKTLAGMQPGENPRTEVKVLVEPRGLAPLARKYKTHPAPALAVDAAR